MPRQRLLHAVITTFIAGLLWHSQALSQPGVPLLSREALIQQAQARRDQGQWQEALQLYREGQQRFPDERHFFVREVMTLADAGTIDRAQQSSQALIARYPDDPDVQLAAAYVRAKAASPYAALTHAGKAADLAPQRAYIIRDYVLALKRARLAEPAFTLAKANRELFDPAQLRSLEADALAEELRLLQVPSRDPQAQQQRLNRLVQRYDTLIGQWRILGAAAAPDVLRLQTDRLIALHAADRYEEVTQGYETLTRGGAPVADYALGAVADSYLQQRRPAKAAQLYQWVLASPTANYLSPQERESLEAGLYYALLESGHSDQAGQLADALSRRQPVWIQERGTGQRIPNNARLQANTRLALHQLYVNDTVGAQDRLETMVANAPANWGLRIDLATVYRARGWPHRAAQELDKVQADAPLNPSYLAERGQTSLELNRWEDAEQLLTYLQQNHPDAVGTRRLQESWDLHRRSVATITAGHNRSTNSPVTGNGDWRLESVVYSSPLAQNHRVFGGIGHARGEFSEGNANVNWVRTGWEWRDGDRTAELEANALRNQGRTRPGVRIGFTQALGDTWTLGAGLHWRDIETPLRALASDIQSNRATATARWRRDDRGEWALTVSGSRFSDGNKRLSVQLAGKERLHTTDRVTVDAELSIYASRNSALDTPYFNPRSDLEVVPALRVEHVLYHHYDTRLTQQFRAGAGVYRQQGYGSGAVGLVEWGLRYRHNRNIEVGFSVTGISHPYDGDRDRDLRVMLDMSIAF